MILPVHAYMRSVLKHFKPWFGTSGILLFLLVCLNPANAEVRILMLGDSITAGYGLASKEALPVKLEEALRRQQQRDDIFIINGGVSGDTTAGGLARIEWLLHDNPDAVIVALGGNDTLRGIAPQNTRRNLDQLLGVLAARRLPTLLAGMRAPRNLGEDYTQRFDLIFSDLAQKYTVLFYPFLLEGVATINALNQADGIHPNPQGVATIVERLLPKTAELLENIKGAGS